MPEPLSGPISKRRFLRVMALGAAASVLAACGTAQAPAAPTAPAAKPTDAPKPAAPTAAAAPTTAAAAPTSGAAATSAPAAAAQPTEAAKPGAARSGGTFTYAEAGDFTNFNPWNFSAVNFGMYDQVFSRLLWKDGAGKANPDLAESWQLAPDNLSIRLKLRSGLKWHDDKAVATQDFVDMFGYLKDDALATDLSVQDGRVGAAAVRPLHPVRRLLEQGPAHPRRVPVQTAHAGRDAAAQPEVRHARRRVAHQFLGCRAAAGRQDLRRRRERQRRLHLQHAGQYQQAAARQEGGPPGALVLVESRGAG